MRVTFDPAARCEFDRVFEWIAWVGRIFIAITLGVLFAGVYMSALTAMIERLGFVINFFRQFIGI